MLTPVGQLQLIATWFILVCICHLQSEITLYYTGNKFFYFKVKLPNYFISTSIKLQRIKEKTPSDVVAFIESDVMDFVISVCGHEKTKLEDLQNKLIFEAIDNKEANASAFKYNRFQI